MISRVGFSISLQDKERMLVKLLEGWLGIACILGLLEYCWDYGGSGLCFIYFSILINVLHGYSPYRHPVIA